MNPKRVRSGLLAGLAWMAAAHAASAQPAPADEATAARIIILTVAAHTDDQVTQIVSYLRPLLEMRGLRLAVRRVDSLDAAPPDRSAPEPGVRTRVWLDLKTADQAQVLFAAGDQPPTAGRVVPTGSPMDQVAAAEIAEIILAALLAPEGPRAPGAPSGEPPPALASAASPEARPGTWQRSLGALGAAQSWARDAVAVPQLGLSVLFEWRPSAAAWSRAVWSSVRYRPPFEPAQSPVRLRLRGGEVEVLAVVARAVGGRGRLGLAAGLGVDARLVEPTPVSGTMLVNEQPVREVAVFLRSAVRFEMPVADPVSVFAAVTLDFFPLQDRLLVRQSGEPRALFTPWPLRPGALAGASVSF